MRVLVSGGAGFIGSHIVESLVQVGHQPFVVDDFSTGDRRNLPVDIPLFEVDICDGPRLSAVFDEVQPQWVCHQAAQMSVSRSMREPVFDANVNVLGFLQVLDNSARVGVQRLVFASSGGTLYGEISEPATEDAYPNPICPYGIAKWVGEKYLEFFAREHGLEAVALRYSNVYGPRQNPKSEAGVVSIFSERLLVGEPAIINGDGKCVRDYVYVTDVARANVLAFESVLASPFAALNIGTGKGTNVNDLAAYVRTQVQAIWKQSGRTGAVPECLYGEPRIGDLRSSLICPDLARLTLGWQPIVSIAVGLERTVSWFATSPNARLHPNTGGR